MRIEGGFQCRRTFRFELNEKRGSENARIVCDDCAFDLHEISVACSTGCQAPITGLPGTAHEDNIMDI
jgi:hypothetical protein